MVESVATVGRIMSCQKVSHRFSAFSGDRFMWSDPIGYETRAIFGIRLLASSLIHGKLQSLKGTATTAMTMCHHNLDPARLSAILPLRSERVKVGRVEQSHHF